MDKKKIIYVLLDTDIIEVYSGKYIFPSAHDSVIREMKQGTDIIYTYDPCFFSFDTLDKGYDVIVLRNGKGIVLSELLKPGGNVKYGIDKEIRWGNNTCKMLMAGCFTMKTVPFKIPPPDHPSIGIMKHFVRKL